MKNLMVVLAVVLGASLAHADYDSHPSLDPVNRCGNLPGGADDPNCQPLYWDMPARCTVGERIDDAQFDLATDGLIAGYPKGESDRPPTMYYDVGTGECFERNFHWVANVKEVVPSRELVCSQPGAIPDGADPVDYVPFWKKLGDVDGDGDDDYELACQRGSRLYFGPWSFGADDDFEKVWRAVFRVANSDRLDRDVAADLIAPNDRREWYAGLEIYNHLGSHHANMWDPVKDCNDPDQPEYASSAACQTEPNSYQVHNYDESGCRSDSYNYPGEGPKRSCPANSRLGNPSQWRAATQYPGRFEVEFPDGRALPLLENQLWPIEHHVVSRGFYVGAQRNFNEQNGGVVGEIVLQVFTDPFVEGDYKRISVLFETVTEAASLYVPPFTIAPNMGVWYAPYDLELALLTTHSHKRTVKSYANVWPANPPRLTDTDPECGGAGGGSQPKHVFENFTWDDAKTCKYYESPDGNLILRKGQGLTFGCIFNNGVRTTKDLPEPLQSAIESSPLGEEVLYGRQARDIYRVKFGCEEHPNVQGEGLPPEAALPGEAYSTPAWVPPGQPVLRPSLACAPPEDPNDDNPYVDHEQCPPNDRFTGRCVPSALSFSDAEDEMCILVGMYWPLEMPVDTDVDADGQAVRDGIENQDPSKAEEVLLVGEEPVIVNPDALEEDPDKIGTPGRLPKSPSDIGKCEGCSQLFPPLI